MGGFKVMGRSIAGSFFVECLLREAGAPYEYVHISRTHGKSPEFLALNPHGNPVLELPDGGGLSDPRRIFIHLSSASRSLRRRPDHRNVTVCGSSWP